MNDLQYMDWVSIENALLEAVDLAKAALAKAGLEVQADDIQVLIEAGEYGVALEQLVSHLDQINRHFSPRIYELIEQAGKLMKMDSRTWEVVRHLAKGD